MGLINITYFHRILAQLRTVWASALHADAHSFGNNWIRVDFDLDRSVTYGEEDPRDPGYIIGNYAGGAGNYGGRKTNGTAVTNPMQVLYDGPRLFVARLVTRIYDHPGYLSDDTSADIPLVEVRIYIVFNKAKKEVVLFKELKTLVSDKIADELKIQFSNRGEVDLGADAVGYDSYFHFYTQGTSRGPNWVGPPPPGQQGTRSYENNDTLTEGLPTVYDRNWVMNQTEDPLTSPYYNYTAAGPYPQLTDATYDVAVAINPNIDYTWWAAFWPSLSDWSIDGWDMWWRSMSANDPHDIDSRTWAQPPRYESSIPFYIAEWDCVLKPLGKTTEQQYRFVTIYGVTDQHNADDVDMGQGHSNVIDRETMYLLNEYFNPWDLQSAVEKKNNRYVEFTWGSTWTSTHRPVIDVSDAEWDQYCMFSERVIDLWPDEVLLHRIADDPLMGSTKDYDFSVDPDTGYATITGLDPEHYYKILYSTETEYESSYVMNLPVNTEDVNGTTGQNLAKTFYWGSYVDEAWTDPTGVSHEIVADEEGADTDGLYFSFTNKSSNSWTTDMNFDYDSPWIEWDQWPFKVFKEDTFITEAGTYFDPHNITIGADGSSGVLEFYLQNIELNWIIEGPQGPLFTDLKDVHFTSFNPDFNLHINVFYNHTTMNYTVSATVYFLSDGAPYQPIYAYYLPGRYEWGIVGRDAYTVDSAGLANVAAALKNKQVEFGLAGQDMFAPEVGGNAVAQMPWVMSKIGLGTSWANYYYGASDFRTALRDDYSSAGTVSGDEWPISSSNMIGVGGPLANMLAYYGNDFTDALFGLSQFTTFAAWINQIVPLTCWNAASDTRTYTSNNTVGYAVISTYKDLNGTVLFLIWGHWGRDTYYVTKWFHEYGIMQLQEAPPGVTSIVVKITYESTSEGYKPTSVTIPEVLGTISERLWIHNGERKGGIHDP